jgi:hypothetical protein
MGYNNGHGRQHGFTHTDPMLLAEPLRGYRVWGPTPPTRELTGMTITDYLWQPGKNVATCFRRRNDTRFDVEKLDELHDNMVSPVAECGCGFWAYTSEERTSTFASNYRLKGVMLGWGKFICGPEGFRSQYARIEALCTQGRFEQMLEGVKEYYPAVKWFKHWEELLEEFPPTNLKAFIDLD